MLINKKKWNTGTQYIFILHLLDSSREADDREEETVHVEVLKHALNWEAVDTERDTGDAQVQTAADHVVRSEGVSSGRRHLASNGTCTAEHRERKTYNKASSIVGNNTGSRSGGILSPDHRCSPSYP